MWLFHKDFLTRYDNKVSSFIFLVASSFFVVVIGGYSRDSREFTSLFNSFNSTWDIVFERVVIDGETYNSDELYAFNSELEKMSTYFNRETVSYLEREANLYFQEFYQIKLSTKSLLNNSLTWLEYSDGMTQSLYSEAEIERFHLKYGYFKPRLFCFFKDHAKLFPDRCLLYSLAKYYNILGIQLTETNLVTFIESSLDGLLTLAEALFNSGWLYHSEAFSTFLLSRLIPGIENIQSSNSSHSLEVAILDAKIRCSNILSTVLIQSNRLHFGVVFGLLAMTLERDAIQISEISVYSNKLRIILAVPSEPPPTEIAKLRRDEMLRDMSAFVDMLKSNKVSFSFKDLPSFNPVFFLAHQGLNDRDFQERLQQIFLALCPDLMFTASHLLHSPPLAEEKIGGEKRRKKIGFVSSHFFQHSIGRILADTIASFADIQRESADIYIFFMDKDFYHNQQKDEITSIFESLVSTTGAGARFVRLPQVASIAREEIAGFELDFLLFADLGMEPQSYFVAFSRLATYQAAWWGHPITTGLDSIDYFFGLDDESSWAGLREYSEQLMRYETINTIALPKYSKTSNWDDEKALEAGLHVNATILTVVGRLFKIHPDFCSMIAKLLSALDREGILESQQVFIVFTAENIDSLNSGLVSNIGSFLQRETSDSLAVQRRLARIKLVHFAYYADVLAASRVVLDTFPYGGCISSHDALYHGVPIVSFESAYVRGRFTRALYRQMGSMDLVTTSIESYIKQVIHLIQDDEYYWARRKQLQIDVSTKMRKNLLAAMEWSEFINRLLRL